VRVFIVNTLTRIHSICFIFCDFDEICECLKALLIVLISFIVVTVLTIKILSILLHMCVFIHTSCIDLCHYQRMVQNGPPMHNLSTMLILLTTDFSQWYSVKIPLYCGMTQLRGRNLPKNTAHVREDDKRVAVDGSEFASNNSLSERDDNHRH